MSQNTSDDPGSPSDRFIPRRAASTNPLALRQSATAPGPTSDLSQAIGNVQNATQGRYQPAGYQSEYAPQTYQSRSYPSQSYPSQSYPSQSYPSQSYPSQGHPSQRYRPLRAQPPSYQVSSGQHQDYRSHDQEQSYLSQAYQPPDRPEGYQPQSNQDPSDQQVKPVSLRDKWTPEGDALMIKLRGRNVIWEEIAKRFPGRSAQACRHHYRKCLEKPIQWTEDQKDQLARVYDKKKEEMWAEIAKKMKCSIKEAEAMHWELGEVDLADRAGAVPFSQVKAPQDYRDENKLRREEEKRQKRRDEALRAGW